MVDRFAITAEGCSISQKVKTNFKTRVRVCFLSHVRQAVLPRVHVLIMCSEWDYCSTSYHTSQANCFALHAHLHLSPDKVPHGNKTSASLPSILLYSCGLWDAHLHQIFRQYGLGKDAAIVGQFVASCPLVRFSS